MTAARIVDGECGEGKMAMTEIADTDVRVRMSKELISQLGEWSPPVTIRVERDDREPTGWTMTVKTMGDDDG